jgi:hypothetical protein
VASCSAGHGPEIVESKTNRTNPVHPPQSVELLRKQNSVGLGLLEKHLASRHPPGRRELTTIFISPRHTRRGEVTWDTVTRASTRPAGRVGVRLVTKYANLEGDHPLDAPAPANQ